MNSCRCHGLRSGDTLIPTKPQPTGLAFLLDKFCKCTAFATTRNAQGPEFGKLDDPSGHGSRPGPPLLFSMRKIVQLPFLAKFRA
jgi:hypothetical protein